MERYFSNIGKFGSSVKIARQPVLQNSMEKAYCHYFTYQAGETSQTLKIVQKLKGKRLWIIASQHIGITLSKAISGLLL